VHKVYKASLLTCPAVKLFFWDLPLQYSRLPAPPRLPQLTNVKPDGSGVNDRVVVAYAYACQVDWILGASVRNWPVSGSYHRAWSYCRPVLGSVY
jgi:hypothetical protein